MNRSRRVPMLLVLLLLLSALSGCRSQTPSATLQGLTSPATVTRDSVSDVVAVSGQVVALNSKTLTFGTVGGRVVEVKVHRGQQVREGDALVLIDPTPQERALREAQADLKVAEVTLANAQAVSSAADLASAQAALHTAQAERLGAQVDLTAAQQAGIETLQQAVDDAQAALLDAQDNLKQTEASSNQSTIRTLEYNQAYFERALRDLQPGKDPTDLQNSLATVKRQLASAQGVRQAALTAAADTVTRAQQTLADARAALARAQAGQQDPTTSTRLALEKAAAGIDKAQKTLDEAQAGGDSDAVKNARTAYDAAKARVTTAQTNLTNSTLVAPFAGVVFDVYVSVDQYVQANTNIVYLADPQELQVSAQVTEMDIAKLQAGQAVRFTFDAWPNQIFDGKLLDLPATGTSSGGLTTYAINMSLEQGQVNMRTGTLANVRIVVGEKENVLTIPSAAVQYTTSNKPFVVVRDNGGTHDQSIEIGINDGVLTEVLSGLSEGQVVLVPLISPGASQSSATVAAGQRTPGTPAQGTPTANQTPQAPGQGTPPAPDQTPGAPRQGTPPANRTPGAQRQGTPPANWTPGAQRRGTPAPNQTPGQGGPGGNRNPTPTATAQSTAVSRG